MDCSSPGSSVHGISQARILEWVAISFSRELSDPGIQCISPALAGGFFLLSRQRSPGTAVVKNLPANSGDARDEGSVSGSGRSPGEGNGNPLQYSCLKNSMESRVWQTAAHGVTKRQTRLSTRSCACTHTFCIITRIRYNQKGS